MSIRLFSFVGGGAGDSLPAASRLAVVGGSVDSTRAGAAWCLRGITSNERYATVQEKEQLLAKQQGLGRPEAVCTALIPIRKMPSGGACRRMNVAGSLKSVPTISGSA